MALLKKITFDNGRFAAEYFRVGSYNYDDDDHMNVTLFAYKDAADRAAGNPPIKSARQPVHIKLIERLPVEETYHEVIDGKEGPELTRMIPGPAINLEDDLDPADTMKARVYDLVKTDKAWADSVDC